MAQQTTVTVTGPSEPVTALRAAWKRLPWQRLMLSFIGIAIVIFVWWWATKHLYSLPVTSIAAFASITTNALYVIASLVIFFVTGQVFYNWVNQSATTIVQEAGSYWSNQKSVPPKYYDDPSIE